MICPYRQKSTKHVEQHQNDLVDEETGVTRGTKVTFIENFEYCECEKDNCGAWHKGKCCYKD